MCGDLQITATGRLFGSIDSSTQPVAYDSITGNLSVFSENLSLIESRETVTVVAIFSDYPTLQKQVEYNIDFLDPCKDASLVSITPQAQTALDPYYYDGSYLLYALIQPQVEPPFCEFVFKCALDFSSPRTDLCALLAGSVQSFFSLVKAQFIFRATD